MIQHIRSMCYWFVSCFVLVIHLLPHCTMATFNSCVSLTIFSNHCSMLFICDHETSIQFAILVKEIFSTKSVIAYNNMQKQGCDFPLLEAFWISLFLDDFIQRYFFVPFDCSFKFPMFVKSLKLMCRRRKKKPQHFLIYFFWHYIN